MNYRIIAGFICALTCSCLFSSQPNSVNLEHFSTENGLSQSSVYQLMQDRQGYLWVGTSEGLNKFDAYRFQIVHGLNNSLDGKNIGLLHQDKKGQIWIGAAPNFNYRYAPESDSFKLLQLPERNDDNSSFNRLDMAVEDGQILWLASYNEIFTYNYLTERVEKVKDIKDILPKDIVSQHAIRELFKVDHFLLIATSHGLYSLNTLNDELRIINNRQLPKPNNDQINIKGLFHLTDNQFYIAAVEGLVRLPFSDLQNALMSNSDIDAEVVEAKLNIWDIVEHQNRIWVATDDGLYELLDNQLSFVFRYSDLPYDVYDNDITDLEPGREGNLWLSSREDGFFMWNPVDAIINVYSNKRGQRKILPSNTVWDTYQASSKEVLIGTTHGLAKLDLESGKTDLYFVNEDEKEVYGKDSISKIVSFGDDYWLSRYNDTLVVNQNSLSIETPILSPEMQESLQKPAYGLSKISPEKLFFLQDDNAYIYDRSTQKLEAVEALKAKKNEDSYTLVLNNDQQLNDRRLYLSKYNQVSAYDTITGDVIPIHQIDANIHGKVLPQSILKLNDQLWISYHSLGIFVIDEKSGEEVKFISGDNLGSQSLLDLFSDNVGNVWTTSNDGLIKIHPTNYSAQLFNRKDGFPSDEFIGGTALRLKENEVLLATTKGLVHVDLQRLSSKRNFQPRVTLSEINLLSKPDMIDKPKLSLTLEHDDIGLNIKFSALIFLKTNQVKYRYWIEGDSKIEPTETNQSELFFPKINPGKSQLYISAIDYKTGMASEPLQFNIKVSPAPWRSPWAYLAYVLIIGSVVGTIYYQRRKRQLALLQAHKVVTESEERLQLALSGSDSGMWDWQQENNVVYEPRLQGIIASNNLSVPFDEKLTYVHPNDQIAFEAKWAEFLNSEDDAFNYTYRMRSIDGDWRWYRDLARVTNTDKNGNPIRVTGTYTDITERKDTQDKMQLFFEAFDNTREVIIILDSDYRITAVNHAFWEITGLDEASILNRTLNCLIKPESKVSVLPALKDKLSQSEQCESEGFILRKYRDPLPVIINGTRFKNKEDEHRYVITVTDISEQKAAQEELRKLANYDPLTGLPNRALLMDRITHAIEHSQRRKNKLAVLFIDLDRFKQINDTLGHEVGDLLLIEVARILKSCIRKNDTAARLGGDEFVVMLEDISTINTASRISTKILEKMRNGFLISNNEINTSPSIGISIYPDDGHSPDEVIKHADMAMYHAKGSGRNNFQFFEANMNVEAQSKLSMEQRVRRALKEEEFSLMYQPQVNVLNGFIIGFEALARWKTAEGEMVPPNEFIPVLEELGLIIPATELFIRMALKELKRWQEAGFHPSVAINLSAHHLSHLNLISYMREVTQEFGVSPNKIELELTESLLMDDIENSLPIIEELAKLGIELSLDDFGTGYSSLKYLHELPIHKLKIDQNFVWQIGKQPESEAIIETIISLSKSLKLQTVVEGVETKEQLHFVTQLGANNVQGYYFSKPLTPDDAMTVLDKKFEVL